MQGKNECGLAAINVLDPSIAYEARLWLEEMLKEMVPLVPKDLLRRGLKSMRLGELFCDGEGIYGVRAEGYSEG
jgi:hypothetical protein